MRTEPFESPVLLSPLPLLAREPVLDSVYHAFLPDLVRRLLVYQVLLPGLVHRLVYQALLFLLFLFLAGLRTLFADWLSC